MIDSLVNLFSPYTALSKELQAMFQLARLPACRAEHGRLEILIRGAGMTAEPLSDRITLAHRLVDAARPLLRAHRKREGRRHADRAIAISFEDEQVIDGGIATTKFSYVALMGNEPVNDSGNRLPR